MSNKIIIKSSKEHNNTKSKIDQNRTCPECGKLTPFVFDKQNVKKIGLFKKEITRYQTFRCKDNKCGCVWKINL